MQPFLKWPGGKRWLISQYFNVFPTQYNRYIEPFLGGGAIFFCLKPKNAILSDINGDLISTYIVMRDHPQELVEYLCKHEKEHSSDYYYTIRATEFDDPIESAARFLYLNRACFNGMYRVNKDGKFNVPIGTKTNFTYDIEQFIDYSNVLKNVDLRQCDFLDSISRAGKNDLVFADPPYTVSHKQSGFIKYNDHLFTWEDQKRLFEALVLAKERGAIILLTNASHDDIKGMYLTQGFFVESVQHHSLISGKADKRRLQEELLISSHPFSDIKKERS